AVVLRGEIARARKDAKVARQHYEAALKLEPGHPTAILGIARLVLAAQGNSRAIDYIQSALPIVLLTVPLRGQKIGLAAGNLESLTLLANDMDIAALCREALLAEVEAEPDLVRRGLRYFFAATIDARLGEYNHARAHAVLARDEFRAAEVAPPVDVDAFLGRVETLAPAGR